MPIPLVVTKRYEGQRVTSWRQPATETNRDINRDKALARSNLFGYIVYTEQVENHGTIILEGVCRSAIHFGRVILSRTVEPSRSQYFVWRVPLSGTFVRCVSPNVMLSIQYALYIISLKTLDLPSGESALSQPTEKHRKLLIGVSKMSCLGYELHFPLSLKYLVLLFLAFQV